MRDHKSKPLAVRPALPSFRGFGRALIDRPDVPEEGALAQNYATPKPDLDPAGDDGLKIIVEGTGGEHGDIS